MKKIILTTVFVITVFLSHAQKLGNNASPFPPMLKKLQTNGDTIWLYHRYDINQWKDGEFHPYLSALFEYYPETANQKYAITINMEQQDTMNKYNYYYDDSNRIVATVTQNYTGITGNLWFNYDSVTQAYNTLGLDSLIVRYVWNSSDSTWDRYKSRGTSYYKNIRNNLIYKDTVSVWNGQEWVINNGYKTDYLFNEFGNVYEKKFSLYQGGKWEYDFWNVYHLINDTTGEYDSKYTRAWVNGKWENYERFSEIVLHDWHGFTNNVPPTEQRIYESWDPEKHKWYYINNDTTTWDSFGSNTVLQYYWHDSSGWYLRTRLRNIYNERGLRIISSHEVLNNNHWDTIYADRYFFEYLGSIWKAMHYERYDTALMKWVPAYDHILSDFTYILNTPGIKGRTGTTGLHIIPNPSRNSVTVRLDNESERIKSIKVYDLTGRVAFQKSYFPFQNGVRIDISAFKNGTYIVNVETGKGKNRKGKLIKN